MRSGRRPSPEGTRFLFAGMVSPMIREVDGPTERQHDKTRRKTRKEEGRDRAKKQNKTSSPMSAWWAKDDTRDKKEGRDEGLKNNNKKTQQKVPKTKQN